MKVEVVSTAGFCEGAKASLKMALEVVDSNTVVWGGLLHDPLVTKQLAQAGAEIVEVVPENLPRLNQKKVVLCAHGTAVPMLSEIRRRAAEVIDTECPTITAVHEMVKAMRAEGRKVVVVGGKDHAEALATLSHTQNGILVSSRDELRCVNAKVACGGSQPAKYGIVAQTTCPEDLFLDCVSELVARSQDTLVYNSLCVRSLINQRNTEELAQRVDAMVVIGGANSCNTRCLYEASAKYTRTIWIQDADELAPEMFANAGIVGIAAGTSTPPSCIEAVCAALQV
jgi:4-hydroxy-3-methylbut-2-enyl diphosphate reductase